MNLPNKLTVVRVLMIPFFVWFMLPSLGGEMAASKWIALAIFCIASLTDLLDGKIARKYNLVTNFGKFMDPLADKLLVGAAMICLVEMGRLPGKFKTVFQMAMIIVLIAAFEGSVFAVVEQILIWVSLILTIVSLVDYIRKNKEVLTQGGM